MNNVIVIMGPTASGKTGVSIKIAQDLKQRGLDPVIINFDSLLFYREISIGTAKPTMEERSGIEHRLIDIASISDPQNASNYVHRAEEEIIDAHKNNRIPILVGGSGFYVRALIKGMYDATTPPLAVKNEVDKLYQNEGIIGLRNFLKRNDPESLQSIHENDVYRNSRAVEFFLTTGRKISDQKKQMDNVNPYDFAANVAHPDWKCTFIYLDVDKDLHYPIIQKRARQMIEDGLIEEVKQLLADGFTGNEKPLLSVGYKEVQDYLNGVLKTKEELVERISISTRQLAKSQRTFFKKVAPKFTFCALTDVEKILETARNEIAEVDDIVL